MMKEAWAVKKFEALDKEAILVLGSE